MKIKYLIIIIAVLAGFSLKSQDTQRIVIPLSKPGEKGLIDAGLIKGSIIVSGYEGKEVIIDAKLGGKSIHRYKHVHKNYQDREKDREDCERDDEDSNDMHGLKKISPRSFEIEAEEKNNTVEVRSHSYAKKIDLHIKVPKNFSVKLSAVNDGEIIVDNVSGKHEVTNVNGNIKMKNISGSVIASNVNGVIVIKFDKITAGVPMAFTSMNGKIDLTVPSTTKANLKMKTQMGDIYTDFDLDITKSAPIVDKSSKSGTYRVKVDQYFTAKLNGGGPEFRFKNFNGDIIIRKKK